MSRNSRNTVWFWLLLVLLLVGGYSGIVAASTHDKACGSRYAAKHWEFFPPHWECDRRM